MRNKLLIGCADCPYDKTDCFAYHDGTCIALSVENDEPECVFYKSKEKYEKDLERHPYVYPNPSNHSRAQV